MTTKHGFRTSEVSSLTGLTIRQLDYWDRTGLFRPSLAPSGGRGSARFYSLLDVTQLKVAKRLLDAGLSVKRLDKCLQFLRENLRVEDLLTVSLVTDGSTIFMLTEDPSVVVDLLNQGQVAWAVKLGVELGPVKKTQ